MGDSTSSTEGGGREGHDDGGRGGGGHEGMLAKPAAVAAEAATQHPQPAAQGTGRGSLSQAREGQRGECSLGRKRAGRRGRGQNHLRIAAARSGWRCSLREMLATMRALTSLLMSRMSCLRAGTPAAVMRA